MTNKFQAKPFKSIEIIGRRWFQRSYGNTYNTVVITIGTDNGYEEHELPMEYGYDDYYLQRAMVWLGENGWLNIARNSNGSYDMPLYSDREALQIHTSVQDVQRKKDL